jgi:membrane protease subunit HflK
MSDNDRPHPVLLKLPQMADLPRPPLGALRWILLGLVLLFAALTTYFQLAPYEQGVVLRFGRHVRTVGSGPHLKLPFGIEQVYRVETEKQHKLEFGFRTKEAAQRTTYEKEGFGEESSMLTGDLNIADVEWVVQYRIDDPYKFLFELRDPVETIRVVAEAEMRGVVGDMGFNEVIKSKRAEIEELVRTRMNEILATYQAGVDVKIVQLQDVHPPAPVKDSFEEVNRALQEMERSVNEALQERNKVLFRVEGEAKQRVAEAEGTKIERVNRAEGDGKRFALQLAEYRKAPAVTRQRLYLEAMQEVLPKAGRILVIDDQVKGMLPLLNLQGEAKPAAGPPPGGGQ